MIVVVLDVARLPSALSALREYLYVPGLLKCKVISCVVSFVLQRIFLYPASHRSVTLSPSQSVFAPTAVIDGAIAAFCALKLSVIVVSFPALSLTVRYATASIVESITSMLHGIETTEEV